MRGVRIETSVPAEIIVDLICDCGKKLQLHSAFGGHPSFCGNCEKAFYLKSHSEHYHIEAKTMNRHEILQESYGRIS